MKKIIIIDIITLPGAERPITAPFYDGCVYNDDGNFVGKIIDVITPPTDDEIEEHFLYNSTLYEPAKWMRDRILKRIKN